MLLACGVFYSLNKFGKIFCREGACNLTKHKKAKHSKKNLKDKKPKKVIIILIQILLILLLIYSLVQIGIWYINNKQSQKIMDQISNSIVIDTNKENEIQEDKYKIDFDSLKRTNADTVAFLKVNGTEVQYPVVKGTNNDFYLSHSFDKSYNAAGWIFADYKNKFDGTDKNIIVYGHNRRDGSMFFTLKNILNEDWYKTEENLKVQFITENEQAIYQVFSVYQIEAEEYYIKTNFKDNEEYTKFLETIKKRSINNFGIDVNTGDSILTLSTCANNNKYRVVLHAKKIINQ